MANSITSFNTFTARTIIRSAEVNSNFSSLKNLSPIWQKYTVPYTSFSALGATATGSVVLFSISAAEILDAFLVKHSTLFTGTSITAAKIKIGKSGSTDEYTDEFDVNQTVAAAARQATNSFCSEFSATSVLVTLSTTGGLLSQLSQGSVDIYVRRAEIP